jgi:hypothetical protein
MTIRKYWIPVLAFLLCGILVTTLSWAQTPSFSVGEARNLPPSELAKKLIGEHLGSNVIQAVRRE